MHAIEIFIIKNISSTYYSERNIYNSNMIFLKGKIIFKISKSFKYQKMKQKMEDKTCTYTDYTVTTSC